MAPPCLPDSTGGKVDARLREGFCHTAHGSFCPEKIFLVNLLGSYSKRMVVESEMMIGIKNLLLGNLFGFIFASVMLLFM